MRILLAVLILVVHSMTTLAQSHHCRHDSICNDCENEQSFCKAFPEIKKEIEKFYAGWVFRSPVDADYNISDICTSEFMHKLSRANEFDSSGYATWLLRSGEQDGDDTPCVVLSVVPGENNTVVVTYSDMGHRASTTLTMVESDGKWKIDNCSVPTGFNPL